MSLSIIIPCFNEEKIIFKTVSELKKKIHFNHEIILIDDLSTDKTWIKMKKCKKKYKNILIFKNSSKGLGNAISLGVRKSLKKYVVIFMSDLSDDINDLQKYLSDNTIKKTRSAENKKSLDIKIPQQTDIQHNKIDKITK